MYGQYYRELGSSSIRFSLLFLRAKVGESESERERERERERGGGEGERERGRERETNPCLPFTQSQGHCSVQLLQHCISARVCMPHSGTCRYI